MNPVYTVSGQPVASVNCGEIIEFDVPGYSQAWIIVSQNGRITFDGIMNLPMSPYRLKCPEDVGFFQVSANEITSQNTRGNVIGVTNLTITNEQQSSRTNMPVPAPTATPPPMGSPLYTPTQIIETTVGGPPIQYQPETEPIQAGLFGLDLTTIALFGIAAVVLLPPLFSKRKG